MIAKLITKKESASRYSVHPKTVEKWADAGILPVVKINCRCVRFDMDKCDKAMERRTSSGG
jgi:predicted site-specific integrase-resolvase